MGDKDFESLRHEGINTMLSAIRSLGVAGGIGVLIGIVLVSYIRPTEYGGVAILIAIPTIIGTTIGGIFALLRGEKDERNDKEPNDDNQGNDGGG
jgi:uncharacterized membrane protein